LLAEIRIDAEVTNAARHHEAHIAIIESVSANGLRGGFRQLLGSHGNLQQDRLCRIIDAIHVLLHAEDVPLIAANALEDSIAVKQAMIKDADLRVFLGVKVSINVNLEGHDWVSSGGFAAMRAALRKVKVSRPKRGKNSQ